MEASSGPASYVSVWSSISVVGALRLTDSMPLIALALLSYHLVPEGRIPHCGVTSRHLACATTQTKAALEMPKVSRDSAPQRQAAVPVEDLRGELDGYTVSFTSVLEDIDATPLMKGLPDDRCPCPHWGYVLKGKMTARYADRDEVFEAGDAFYTPPGHVPVQHEPGTEFVWFSPSEELRTAEAVMLKNMQAMQDGSTP